MLGSDLAGPAQRVVPTLGHLPVRMITNGSVDRVVHAWIADECGRSTVKNSLAMLVRVMEQASVTASSTATPPGSPAGSVSISGPRTSWMIPGRWRCPIGTPCGGWPLRWSSGRPTTTGAGVR